MLKDFLPRYPPLRLDHLERLTDSVGILQHATHSVPDPRHGYSIDDQARALIATLQHANLAGNRHAPKSAYIYMSYLRFAATFDGGFHNFLSFSRTWNDEKGSEDAHGRAMWALGYATRFGIDGGLAAAAAQLFDDGTTLLEQLSWSRAWAFSLFGLYHRLKAEPSGKLLRIAGTLADRLVEQFDRTAATGWQWFDDELTYCNAKLPAALLLAHELTASPRYLEVGISALQWLFTIVFNAEGQLRLVGEDGWYRRGGTKAPFDEQCVDAQGTVEAALIAYRVTGHPWWLQQARAAFDWFFGGNVHGVSLIDPATWGCYDGITAERLNRNMGAESIVCYLLTYLDLVEAGVLRLDGAVAIPG